MAVPILAQDPEWKRFFRLSEELLTQPTALAQGELIAKRVQEVIGGNSKVWFSEPFYPLPGEPPVEIIQAENAPELVKRVLQTHTTEYSIDPNQISPNSDRKKAHCIALPLLTQSNLLGVVELDRRGGPALRKEEIVFLEGLAAHAAVALQINRQVSLKNWRYEQLTLVRSVSAQIANVLNVDEVCRRVVRLIQETFRYYFISIFTVENHQYLTCRASYGQSEQENTCPIDTVDLGTGIIGKAAAEGIEILVRNVQEDKRFRFINALPETKSEIAIPLKIENQVLGILDVQSDQVDAFHEVDIMVLRALADNVALSVEGARLYDSLQRRVDQLSAVFDVSHALTSILDYENLLDEVVDVIQQRFAYPVVHLYTVHAGRRLVIYRAGSGLRSQYSRETELTYSLDDPQGIIPWVARTGQVHLAKDVSKDPLYKQPETVPFNTRAELTIPLKVGDDVLGVLDIQSDKVDAFDEHDQSLLESLAANISITVRNVSLYRSEQWRRQVAESIRDVAGLISANLAIDQLLDRILAELERNLPCDASAIWLVEDPYATDLRADEPLQLASIRGASREALERVHKNSASIQQWLASALHNPEPTIRQPGDPYGPLGAALQYADDYSSIAVPLRAGDQVLGVLTLAHHTSGRYGSEARAMTTSFANYAAVAIQNARLYAAAQEQAWTSTVLLQVAEAVQSVDTMDELLSTITRLIPLLVGIQKCAFFLYDEDENGFVLKSSHGIILPNEREVFFSPRLPAFRQLIETKAILFVEDAISDLELPAAALPPDTGTLVLIPLIARGELLGAFFVAHQLTGMAGIEQGFNQETLSILQGIAQQTSVALESIRLVEARQEEAYITAVLLQVAQAVVSQNDLSDVLDTIVHLMPILVGIDVSIIYLWNAEENKFLPAKAYTGIRSADEFVLQQTYSPGEYPLLDEVFEHDKVLAIPLDGSRLAPDQWSQIQPYQEIGLGISPHKSDWLVASPLSIKGEVFGVLLTRETQVSVRVHEKRLEIINGVAQQISLAIQNERLNKEMVERERMEREFQLAREIQKTFLPDHLPVTPGYMLDIRWETAREVGGDFYDLFMIDPNHLAVVVADVADKGMPAALYMTVTRTLIRASITSNKSPSYILERVNESLIGDSQNGMFVTAALAILNLAEGKVKYANAGHNLPILVHHNGLAEPLPKGGMALAVQENSKYIDYVFALEPGDALFFYTDGVTESFSESGEAFGEERLMKVLSSPGFEDPCQLLGTVEKALIEFRQGQLPSDDLTMVGLLRNPDSPKI